VCSPYNAVQFSEYLIEHADLVFCFDNQAMFNVARNHMHINAPTFTNVNRMIAHVFSSITCSLRFEGALNADLREMKTNLVPFPRLHFVTVSHAPFVGQHQSTKERMSVQDITNSAFEPTSVLTTTDPRHGQYIACNLMYRGDVVLTEMNEAIQKIRKRTNIKFVDWSPRGTKCGINYQQPSAVPDGDIAKVQRSLTVAANTTSIAEMFAIIQIKANILYTRAFAYLPHFEDAGYEQGQMMQALRRIADLQKDYEEIGLEDAPEEDEGEEGEEKEEE